LLENLDRLAHLEDANHVAVVGVAVRAERDAKLETRIKTVAVDLADVVVDAGCAEHRAGDPGANRKLGGERADALRARHQDFVAGDERLVLVEKLAVAVGELLRGREPVGRRIDTAAAETLVVAHHPRAAERLEEIENFFTLAKRIHERRAARARVLK
jgi:hypothetical protein